MIYKLFIIFYNFLLLYYLYVLYYYCEVIRMANVKMISWLCDKVANYKLKKGGDKNEDKKLG